MIYLNQKIFIFQQEKFLNGGGIKLLLSSEFSHVLTIVLGVFNQDLSINQGG